MATDYSARSLTDPVRDELQRVFLIDRRFERKAVAAHPALRVSEDTLSDFINGKRATPSYRLPGLYHALGEYLGIFQCLLKRTDLVVVRLPTVGLRRPPLMILADLTTNFGELYELLGKMVRGEQLTAEEYRQLKEHAAELKTLTDELLNIEPERSDGNGKDPR